MYHRSIRAVIGSALIGGTLLAAGCSSSVDDLVDAVPSEEIVVPDSGNDCVSHAIDGEADAATLCVEWVGDQVSIRATGLEVGSTLTVEGASGDTLVNEVASDQELALDVGGNIVQKSFSVRGTWVDGEELSLTVDTAS